MLLYLDFCNEVKTKKIINQAIKDGKDVYVPYTEIIQERIEIRKFTGWDSLTEGKYGIEYPAFPGCKPEEKNIDIAVMPGIAFDKYGARVGFGKGFYDRLFWQTGIDSMIKIALTYDFQVLDEKISVEKHDVHVDYIITEKRMINCKENRGGITWIQQEQS